MKFNPELGFFPFLADIAYILEIPLRKVEEVQELWKPYFDRGMSAQAAVAEAGACRHDPLVSKSDADRSGQVERH